MRYHKTDWQCYQAAYKLAQALSIAERIVESQRISGTGSTIDCEQQANNYQVVGISTVKVVAKPF